MLYKGMFEILQDINKRPKPFEFYTAADLWTDSYVSKKLLELHLNPDIELASRTKEFINRSVEWIIEHFHLAQNTSLCDFGCGPGLYTSRFAEKKIKATGIDFSERSIKYAQEAALRNYLDIDYIQQDYLQFNSNKKFDLITMIYCDFGALNPSQRKLLLDRFRSLLKPDGAILLDVFSLSYFRSISEKVTYEYTQSNSFWSNEPCYTFLNTFKYNNENLILDKWTMLEASRTRQIFNWTQCYSLDSLKREFQDSGFSQFEFFSNVCGNEYSADANEIAIIARV